MDKITHVRKNSIKFILFWLVFFSVYYISKKIGLNFAFECVVSTIFIMIAIRILYTERYGRLLLKEDLLRGIYDLICYLKEPKIGLMERYVGEYQIAKKAIDNAFIFHDYRIVSIFYRLDEAINTKNMNIVQNLKQGDLKSELNNIVKIKSLSYFLVHGFIFQIFIVVPIQVVDELISIWNTFSLGKSHK